MQVNIFRRYIGQANIGADKLRRRVILIRKSHAVEGGVVQAKLHRERRGGGGVIHLRGRFGLHNADGGAVQSRVIHFVDRLVHIHLVHVHGQLAEAGAHVGARYLVILGEIDISEAQLADVVFQSRSRGVLRRIRVDEGIDDEVIIIHRIGLGAGQAHAAVVQLHIRNINLLVQQRPDIEAHAEVAHGEQRIALLVFEVHAIEVDGVAEIRSELTNTHFCAEFVTQIAFGPARYKILPGGQLQHHHYYDNE